MPIRFEPQETEEFIKTLADQEETLKTPFEVAQLRATLLGAQPAGQEARAAARFGFWLPSWQTIPLEKIHIELWIPQTKLDLSLPLQRRTFLHKTFPVMRHKDTFWSIVQGLPWGTGDLVGTFYRLCAQGEGDEIIQEALDPLAASLPFGAFAPAELYDTKTLLDNRRDKDHFQQNLQAVPEKDGIPRVQPPINILQIHVATATADKTMAGLTELFERTAAKIKSGEELTPEEENLRGYEAVQLMPIEPVIEYEEEMPFWNEFTGTEEPEVRLKKPDMTNWGYDVVISGSPAVNPALLRTGRPDEFLRFIESLHNFPGGPIRIILDIVYGHADNQALKILEPAFLAGPNMYGQNLDYTNPMVRALLLEMQRRKSNYGVDGIRVDGAQDFKYWDKNLRKMIHDDGYLTLMNDLVQEAAGVSYRPYMIFEDGRPWPQDDWELSSSYREITRMHPKVHQWSPLTFAHNTPFLYTFWATRWWRIREMAEQGSHWITGCANHDTLRRGSQVDTEARINTKLGDTLPDIIARAYNNPGTNLLNYAFLPGVPMEFLQALGDAPWSFIRNTDDRYGIKVVSEEALFLDWRVRNADFRRRENFPRLKAMGFRDLNGLKRFTKALNHAVQLTEYDQDAIVKILRSVHPGFDGPEKTVRNLKLFARNWMEDLHDYCNMEQWTEKIPRELAHFNRKLRSFRQENRWLQSNPGKKDFLAYRHPCDGTVLYYGKRTAPESGSEYWLMVNLEGAPITLSVTELPGFGKKNSDGEVVLATPGVELSSFTEKVTLQNSHGVLYLRRQ